jgi:5-methylcytosine-specific restriction endonuclease McrA
VLSEAYWPEYSNPSRPKVKTWVKCALCGLAEAKSYAVVDHILPVVPLDKSFEDMTLDETVDRMWCEPANLQVLDQVCHLKKSKDEAIIRKKYKKERKNVK